MSNAGIKAAQAKLKEMRESGILKPPSFIPRRNAVNNYCIQCMGGRKNPGVCATVRACEIEQCPVHPCRPYQKTPTGRQSLKDVVQDACFECVGSTSDPAPKQRIRDCKALDCALHSVRPWQDIGNGDEPV